MAIITITTFLGKLRGLFAITTITTFLPLAGAVLGNESPSICRNQTNLKSLLRNELPFPTAFSFSLTITITIITTITTILPLGGAV